MSGPIITGDTIATADEDGAVYSWSVFVADANPPPAVVQPIPQEDLLDLRIGQRQATFEFHLLSASNEYLATIDVDITEGVPSITNDTTRTIRRTMDGLLLPPSSTAIIDPLRHRIRPMMRLGEEAYPLGIFLFGDYSFQDLDYGMFAVATMVDQGFALDQPQPEGVAFQVGYPIQQAIIDRFVAARFTTWSVDEGITETLGAPVAWPAGTSGAQILQDLALLANAYGPYFDNAGTPTVQRAQNQAAVEYAVDAASRVSAASTVKSNDALQAANRYIVLDTGAADSPVVGVFDTPDEAPHSAFNRGFVVATVIEEQGLASGAQADLRAKAAHDADQATYELLTFTGPPDPRHDTFQAILYDGILYREQAWNLPLREGAEMAHTLRRQWLETTT